MKKTVISLLGIFMISTFVSCDKHIDASQLPQKAQTFLAQYFQGIEVLSVEKEGTRYDVILTDGTEIDFNKSGDWVEVDCQTRSIPEGIVPTAIQTYVATNFSGNYIVRISEERNGYEVELNNELELLFNSEGQYTGVDE